MGGVSGAARIAAKLYEVDKHYDRQKRTRGEAGKGNLLFSELRRLLRYRNTVPEPEIAVCVYDILDNAPRSAEGLGQAVMLTFAERKHLHIRHMRCFDVPHDEVQRIQRAERRERQKLASRERRRAKQNRPPEPKQVQRMWVIKSKLTQDWQTAPQVAIAVAGSPAFKAVKPDALRQAVHRALDQLGDDIEDSIKPREDGLTVRIVRLRVS